MKRLILSLFSIFALVLALTATASEKTVTLSVKNMTCASCPYIVKGSLEKVDGVNKAVVSLAEQSAVVTFDTEKTNVKSLINATGDVGFPSSLNNES